MKKKHQSEASSLRQNAEDVSRSKQTKFSSLLSEVETHKLIHELEVHQIELEMQNEELVKAKEQAANSSDKYIELYDFAPMGYFTLSRKGEIVQINLCGAAMLGKDRSQLKNKMFPIFISAESRPIFSQFFDKLFSSETKETCELILTNTANRPEYIHLSGIASEDRTRFFITAIDLTERKLAEEAQKQSERELRRQNELFDSLIKNLPMGVFMVEAPSGKPLVANETALTLLGRGILPDATSHNLAEVYQAFKNDTDHPYPVDEMPVIKGMKGESSSIDDMIVIRPDGSQSHLEIFGSPVKDDKGNIWASLVSFSDITKRKLSEAIFRDIVEKNPMSIQILDMEGYPVQINSAHTRLFGVKPPSDYSVLKDQQLLSLGFGELFEQIKKGEVVYFPDSYYNVHDIDPTFPDSPVWIKAVGFTLNDHNGSPERIVLMHEDITERKHAEALLNDIIEKNPMSIQIVDKEGHTLRGNPAYSLLFGAIPPPDFSIFDDLQKKNKELEQLIARAKGGEVVHLPDTYFNPRDEVADAPDIPLWIRALIFPLNDSSGKPERFVFMHENITESKLAEQELIKTKEHAEESDRLKSAFLANMSHEIRTPMNGILGFTELLTEPGLETDKQQEYIQIIQKSGARMLNIINDIVDISKIEAGLMQLCLTDSNINEQIQYIYTFFKPEVEKKGIRFSFKNALPETMANLRTDREKLYAILTNLIKNAIKYTETGSIEFGYKVVETLHATSLPKQTFFEFFIKDTGIGIPRHRQEAIFERFIQADILDIHARQGAGLGLAIAKAYIEMLGGKIRVESEEGTGSAFYFTLPCLAPEKGEKDFRIKSIADVKENQPGKLKILIAEDDEPSSQLISIEVQKYAREIIKVNSGTEAIEVCRNNPDIDLILMDIQMPEMNGYEATREIRQFNTDVFILAETAYALSGDREKAIEAGCNDYLSKPIQQNKLIEILHQQFGK